MNDHALAAAVALVVFLVASSSTSNDLEFLLDLDDYENFVSHPLLTYVAATPRVVDISVAKAWLLVWLPVLGVVEPVTCLLRAALATSLSSSALCTYLAGCALHASNAAQLALLLSEVGAAGLLFGGPSRRAVAAATLVWALHPLRGEAFGWLSCQAGFGPPRGGA